MIDIIIPTYNNEATIERAINSVFRQQYTDWHLTVVNDCSTDNTLEIVNKYKNQNPSKVTVVTNDTNVGAGISRQIGIDNSHGDFVTFLDSDDFLTEDYLSVSMLLQQQHDSDVVYTSFTILFPDNKTEIVPANDYIMEGEATVQLHLVSKYKFLTGKLFRRSLVEKVKFSENRVGEDVQTLFYLTYFANKVRSSSFSGYVHVFREGSLLANKPQFFCWCLSMLCDLEMIEFCIEHDEPKLWHYMLKEAYLNYDYGKKSVNKMDGLTKEDLEKNKASWNKIKKWFETHKQYVKECDTGKLIK